MEIYSIINTLVTIFLGGGWFVYYRANKRKANGEASQAEAEGWLKQQEVYQKTIDDLDGVCQKIRESRDRLFDYNEKLSKENEEMRKENEEFRKKYAQLDERMSRIDIEHKKEIARLGRRVDVLSPFLCGVAGCMLR